MGLKFDTGLLMKKLLTGCLILSGSLGFAQNKQDSVKRLKEVVIQPYFSVQPLIRATGTIGLIGQETLDRQPGSSLVSAVNTVAGVRMEERSPGSYRLSVRGSLLRSPFGVRNIKIYLDDFPLTDAGGNSYLNALDASGTSQLQILKGPHGSIYGANSGGVILIQPNGEAADTNYVAVKAEGGSFGSFRENVVLNQQIGNYGLNITQAYQRSDGYRDHSEMDRKYFQALQKWDYSKNKALKVLLFYSDLHYNTPGGLTAAQYELSPKLSRPAAGASKGAIEQQAGIYSKTIYGGVSHNWRISESFKHVISVFSSYTDFKNPFISNYEKRREFSLGLRTYVEYGKGTQNIDWKIDAGLESMKTSTDFDNFDNNFGRPAAVQALDELNASANFAFVHFSIDLHKKLLLELSGSANLYGYDYARLAPVTVAKKTYDFDVQLMPRVALSYLLTPRTSLRASVSKGYSPPTRDEVRASDHVINVDLQPEYGWNYETGIRYISKDNRLFADVNGFYYNLKSAIVRRLNENDAEFFINAGGTRQWGLESTIAYWVLPEKDFGLLRGLQLKSAYTLSHFKFDNYTDRSDDFSGNDLTGVPKNMIISSADILLPKGIYLFMQHNYTSSIPLNDANTAYAKKYDLVQAKIGWKNLHLGKVPVEIYAGADNLLNQKYSLGNDLNAFGGRYFNAAATRNFYGGMLVRL